MPRFEHILFVCTNARPPGSAAGSCAERGAEALLGRLKELTASHGLKGRVRVVRSGCLDLCRRGCAVMAVSAPGQPAPQTWYTELGAADADALFARHVQQGARLERHVDPRFHRDDPAAPER